MTDLGLFAGPGGWAVAAARLGICEVGIEWDAAACATRARAGHATIRYDVADFPAAVYAGQVRGLIASPPCPTFSAAGKRAGNAVLHILADGIRDALDGRATRAARRREMAAALRAAWWPDLKMTRAARAAAITKAVRMSALAIEPARFIHACGPEWVALEQVPPVLPLWRIYAAELRRAGYSAWCGKLNAADYGVPQTRERAILIASRTRQVWCPEPTHYDPRKGDQLWGERWVSMAEALGWGATGRPPPTVTGGGVAQGGWEPFAKGGREALAREQDAGRWMLRRSRGEEMLDREGRGGRRDHPLEEPAPTITSAGSKPGANLSWVLRTSYGVPAAGLKQNGSGSHGTHLMDPAARPAHVVTGKAKDWTLTRPATTLQCDERLFGPHAGSKGESHSSNPVRITVEEAAALQSFPPGYPWQGTKTAQFRQVGDAVPPRLALHVLSMATGIPLPESVTGGLVA